MLAETSPSSLVTIGITCYNAQDTIKSAIESAALQDWSNLEIVVCDDRSNDSSLTVIHELRKKYSFIQVICNSRNGGPAASRNSILRQAKGKYIVFFDDDDISHKDRIKQQINLLEKYKAENPNVILMCYASGIRIYPSGYIMKIEAIGSKRNPPIGLQIVDYLLFNDQVPGVFYGGGIPACSLAMFRDDLNELGGFDESFRRVEDADLAIRAGFRGAHFIGCSEELYTQFSTAGNDKTADKNYEAELLLVEKNIGYLKDLNIYRYAVNWTKLRYFFFSKKRLKFICCLSFLMALHPVRASSHFIRSSTRRFVHQKKIINGN